ncbi:MAG: SAM-dependent methyltransferase, partial [Oscillospiraceae bacterium]|nr:SAM-dependent methyltransferase [Oscillospiraceae bacterium]
IAGADLVDGTPILDIKPYLPYCDSHPEATSGWTEELEHHPLAVEIRPEVAAMLGNDLPGLTDVLSGDPRPRYQNDPTRAYGLTYGKWNVTFHVAEGVAVVEKITAGAMHESPETR